MASFIAVKKYLAYWFQLGKKLIITNQNKTIILTKVLNGDGFSKEFEECWQIVSNPETGDCYLQGASYTIQELLSPKWEITSCARCQMPTPIIEIGIQDLSCVCDDLDNWPNNELPPPREPIFNKKHLSEIRQSLQQKTNNDPNKLSLKTKITKNDSHNHQQNCKCDHCYLKKLVIREESENKIPVINNFPHSKAF